jgi:hypothetical protein
MGNIQQSAKIETNTNRSSICKLDMKPVVFSELWKNYPAQPPYIDPKTGKPPVNYEDQCAIKISVALHKTGVEMRSYSAKDRIRLNGKNTAALAENLAQWLVLVPFCGLAQKAENVTGPKWEELVKNRTGIIFFRDYWLRKGAIIPAGDHIDLWNRSTLTPGFASFWRFALGFNSSVIFRLSDLGNSKEILFWEIK